MKKQGHGQGQLTSTDMGDGRMRHQWRIWVTLPNGQAQRLSGTSYGSKTEARRQMAEAKRQAERAGVSTDPHLTVDALLTLWLEGRRGHLASRTFNLYRFLIRHHLVPRIGVLRVRALDGLRLQAFYSELLNETGLGRTRQQLHSLLRMALDFAVGLKIIEANPARSVKPPAAGKTRRQQAEDEGEVVVWPVDEAAALMKAAMADDTPFGYAVALGLQTGLRRGELLGVRWRDIKLEERLLTVRRAVKVDTAAEKGQRHQVGDTKTRSSHRTLPLNSQAVAVLEAARAWQERAAHSTPGWQDSGYVFTTDTGGMQHPANLKRTLARLCRTAQVPVRSPHAMRHTFASAAIASGMTVEQVSRLLGHADVTVTLRVYHHFYQRDLRAPEALGY